MRLSHTLTLAALLVPLTSHIAAAQENGHWRFDFGPGAVADGFTQVKALDVYSDEAGFGFISPGDDAATAEVTDVDRNTSDPLCGDFCTSDQPFYFAVKVPEGNYRITVTLGDADAESTTTIHAEVRRLLADRLHLAKGEAGRFAAVVSVRTPQIADADREVRLKQREREGEWPNWDDKLTLTFSGPRPALAGLEIVRDDRCPTLFLIGDSTVSDQVTPPWNSWGQMLPRFFGPTIAVANHAESGESIRGALGERRFEKIYSLIKPGDWVGIQFGHNDMKETSADKLAIYTKNLEAFVAEVRKRGATPILITSMERKNGADRDTLEGYPDAVRDVAKRLGAPLVDLHAMSKVLYRALGADLDAAFQDGTHHKEFGSYELARCVVEGIRKSAPELAAHLATDAGTFDPAHPEKASDWGVPTQPAGP